MKLSRTFDSILLLAGACGLWCISCSTAPTSEDNTSSLAADDSTHALARASAIETTQTNGASSNEEATTLNDYPDSLVRRIVHLHDTMFGSGVEFELKWVIPKAKYNLFLLSIVRNGYVYEILATTDEDSVPVDHVTILNRFRREEGYFFVSYFVYDSFDPNHICIRTVEDSTEWRKHPDSAVSLNTTCFDIKQGKFVRSASNVVR